MPRGGKREGAGAPKKEPTSLINFRIPTKKKNNLKLTYGESLNGMFLKWVDSLLEEKQV